MKNGIISIYTKVHVTLLVGGRAHFIIRFYWKIMIKSGIETILWPTTRCVISLFLLFPPFLSFYC